MAVQACNLAVMVAVAVCAGMPLKVEDMAAVLVDSAVLLHLCWALNVESVAGPGQSWQ